MIKNLIILLIKKLIGLVFIPLWLLLIMFAGIFEMLSNILDDTSIVIREFIENKLCE